MNNETPSIAEGSPQQSDAFEPVHAQSPSRDKCVGVDYRTKLGGQKFLPAVGHAYHSDAQMRASTDIQVSAASLFRTAGNYLFAIHSCLKRHHHGRLRSEMRDRLSARVRKRTLNGPFAPQTQVVKSIKVKSTGAVVDSVLRDHSRTETLLFA